MGNNADLAQATRVGQIVPEVVVGTDPLTVRKRPQALSFEIQPEGEIKNFNPMGYLFATISAPIKRWASVKVEGYPCYEAMAYVLDGVVKKVNPTATGSGYTRVYSPSATKMERLQTYTVESGTTDKATKCTYGIFTGFEFEISRDDVKFSAEMMGQKVEDKAQLWGNEVQTLNITGTPTGGTFTLTFSSVTTATIPYNATATQVQTALEAISTIGAGNVICEGTQLPAGSITITFCGNLGQSNVASITATSSLTGGTTPSVSIAQTRQGGDVVEIASQPILPDQFNLYLDFTNWSSLGTTQYTRGFSVKFSMKDRVAPVFSIDRAKKSFASHVASMPKTEVTLLVGNEAGIEPILAAVDAGDPVYMRLDGQGDLISSGVYYTFLMDAILLASSYHKYTENQSVLAYEFNFVVGVDPTTSKPFEITLVNKLASL